jgi:plastocyanin
VAVLLGVAVVAGPATLSSASEESATAARNQSVSVRDDFFRPGTVTVRRNQTVTWHWRGSNPHNVRFRRKAGRPRNCATKTRGRPCARRFRRRGTFRYVCSIHSGMRGRVVVR